MKKMLTMAVLSVAALFGTVTMDGSPQARAAQPTQTASVRHEYSEILGPYTYAQAYRVARYFQALGCDVYVYEYSGYWFVEVECD